MLFQSLRFELAIPLPKEDDTAIHIVILSLIIVIIFGFVTGLIIFPSQVFISNFLRTDVISNYLWILPFGVVFNGFYKVFTYWNIRKKLFSVITTSKLNRAFSDIGMKLALFQLNEFALIFGDLIGVLFGNLKLSNSIIRNFRFKNINWLLIKKLAIRYRRFPIFSTWAGFANTAGLQLPPLMFASLFSPAAAGIYTVTHRILNTPMSLIGNSVGQVFLSNASSAYREGRLNLLVNKLYSKLSQIGFPITLLVMLGAPKFSTIVFGENWSEIGLFARYLSPWLYTVFVCSPMSTIFVVLEKQKEFVFSNHLIINKSNSYFSRCVSGGY